MYVFVFGINNSGTTVLSQYLARQMDAYLPPFGHNEGQDAPTVRHIFRTDGWAQTKVIDWAFVRAEWDTLLKASGKSVFVEASPPMLLRVAQIRAAFADGFKGLILTSSPYMQIASCLRNYTRAPLAPARLEQLTTQWIHRAERQQWNRMNHPDLPYLTYARFCADPTTANAALDIPVVAEAMTVAGKGATRKAAPPAQPIRDFTVRNASFLTAAELARITDMLRPRAPLVKKLGHALLERADIDTLFASDPRQHAAGQAARAQWNTTA